MAEQDFQERTEKATPRRRRKARQEGKVAKSQDLNAAAVILLGFLSIYLIGPSLADRTRTLMTYVMSNAPTIALSDASYYQILTDAGLSFFTIILPVFAAMTVIAIGINAAQVGFAISPKALEPRFDKLNVINGLKKLFSVRTLVSAVRDAVKLTVIGIVGYKVIESEFNGFFLYPDMPVGALAKDLGTLALSISLKLGVCVLVIAIIDFLYQRYEFEKSIRMSKQEIKEESKDTEGNPQIKMRVRQLQRDMARKRMMADVPGADVVVTNPTHIAVALKYDTDEGGAPTVVAKGERKIAQRIKEIALKAGVPVIEDKPLARALFKMCDIGQLIPAQLYRAVAELLAHIYRIKGKAIN
jgi:flagellar biosynthetic protein FlhB